MRTLANNTSINILQEQFIPDHVFIYLIRGSIRVFDGTKSYTFKAGDACIVRKNRLAKYELLESKDGFEPVLFCFDEPFLQQYQKNKKIKKPDPAPDGTFFKIKNSELIESFIQSIKPYYKGVMQLEEAFEDLKYEELLIILLKNQPELAAFLFEFRKPGKIDLEAFMDHNFTFNVPLQQFAYLTGRSLSAFKRDFKVVFNDTPNHWLMQKRLNEAYFLIKKKNKKSADIYIDLGFEDLSHFSYAFKQMFGVTPTELAGTTRQKKSH